MQLSFDAALVRELLEHSKNSPQHKQTFGETGQGHGLWLVGDEGVYLMSNGEPGLLVEAGKTLHKVCQSEETKDKATRYDVKRAAFGGDDGAEFLPAEGFEKTFALAPDHPFIYLDITPTNIGFFAAVKRPAARPRPPARRKAARKA